MFTFADCVYSINGQIVCLYSGNYRALGLLIQYFHNDHGVRVSANV